ncbi:MAG TPA: zf-TFIIB domain-containing protein [Anaeromyxobacteraceae bacterium]|nr:zf-TFIIB domain-containing protein [Anaeromyxobacteraceae bacterium]
MSDRGTPGKPSNSEDEYFVREDAEKKRKLALQMKHQLQADEQRRLKDLHFMHCPKCGMDMHPVSLRGIDVDVCFSCNGVFLDKSELEHVTRSSQESHGVMSAILNWFKPETGKPV